MYDLKNKKATKLGDYGSYMITADKKKMLVASGGKYAVIDLPKSTIKIEDHVDLSNMDVWVNLKEEWQQIFNEAWRQTIRECMETIGIQFIINTRIS